MTRIRTMGDHTPIGTRTNYNTGTVYDGNKWYRSYKSCEDVDDNPGGNNFFFLTSVNGEPIRASGRVSFYDFDGWGIGNNFSVPNGIAGMTVAAATTNLASRTNPNRAGINLPVSIAELRDLPLLVRGVGRGILGFGGKDSIPSRFAQANLVGQFGLGPIISDVRKLMDFKNSVAKRVSELERLKSDGGLRRRRDIKDVRQSKVLGQYQRGYGLASVLCRETTEETWKLWGTIRFLPGSLVKDPRTSFDKLGSKLFYGLSSGQITSQVWEGLPWSWLADWFGNIGDLIGSNGGAIAYTSRASIMSNRKAVRKMEVISKSVGLELSSMSTTVTYETKARYPGSFAPSFKSGGIDLSPSQASILGSLSVLRGR